MKYFLWLFAATFLLPVLSFAQSNYKPAYVVTTNGDTIRGQIDYRQWDLNPREISLRRSESAKTEKFNITNAKAFNVIKIEEFERYVISASVANVDMSFLSTRDTSLRTDTVFLRVLCKGPVVNLYQYTDGVKSRYYIKRPQQVTPVELIYQVYLKEATSTELITRNFFRNQLMSISHEVKADNKVLDKISVARYKDLDLVKICNMLNGVSEKKDLATGFGTRFTVGAGVNIQSLKYTGDILLAQNATSKTSVTPLLQVGIDFLPNKAVQQYFVRLDLGYTTSNMAVTVPKLTHVLNQRMISFSPQFIYNVYNAEQIKAFVGIGLLLNICTYSKNDYVIASGTYIASIPSQMEVVGSWQALPLHAGITVNKKLELNLCYYFSASPLTQDYTNFQAVPTVYQASIKYLFK